MPSSFLSFAQQARLLISRGMRSKTTQSIKKLQRIITERLRHISYNRFAQYWSSRYSAATNLPPHTFLADTYWEDIETVYMFDRRVRNLLFDAIARVEISLRTTIAHQWSKATGNDTPHSRKAYYGLKRPFTSKAQAANKSGYSQSSYDYLMHSAEKEFRRAKKRGHLSKKQLNAPDVSHLPVWDFMDFCTFGPLSDLISEGLNNKILIPISHTFGFQSIQEFRAVISLLHDIRNACAHQGRVWNRPWVTNHGTPHLKVPQHALWKLAWNPRSEAWEAGQGNTLISDWKTTAAALTYCCCILRFIAPQSRWKERCKTLLTRQENAPFIAELGFNEHWESHPLWR